MNDEEKQMIEQSLKEFEDCPNIPEGIRIACDVFGTMEGIQKQIDEGRNPINYAGVNNGEFVMKQLII